MLGLKIVPIIVILFRQSRGINIKSCFISSRETTAMTIESILSRESNHGY